MMAKFGDAMKSGKMPDMSELMGGARGPASSAQGMGMPQRPAPKVSAAVGQARPMTSSKSKSKQSGKDAGKAKGNGKR